MGNAPVGRAKRGDADGGPQTFRSTTAVVIWWVWLLFFAANMVDLAVQGRDHASAVAAAILVLATGVAYVTAQRPRIVADHAGITIRNPLRDHTIGWAGVTKVDLADLLRVHCAWGGQTGDEQRTKVISAWAVHYSRRRKLAAESRARRAALPKGPRGLSRGPGGATAIPADSAAEVEAEKIARLLGERATAAQAESIRASDTVPVSATKGSRPIKPPETPSARRESAATGSLEPLRSTWNSTALAALIIPALILLIVCLL